MNVTKAIILAGGKGTRFMPYAKAGAKEMLPIGDIPALQFLIREVVAAGIKEIAVVINPEKKQIANYFKPDKKLNNFLYERNKSEELNKVLNVCERAKISFIEQKKQNGSGGAVMLCKDFVDRQPFAFLNGDDVIFAGESATLQLLKQFGRTRSTIVGVQQVESKDISKYGIADTGGKEGALVKMKGVVEKPSLKNAPGNFALLGRNIFSCSFFKYLDAVLPSAGGELLITDAIHLQAQREAVYAFSFDGKRFDLGNKFGFAQAVAWNMAVCEKNADFIEFLDGIISGIPNKSV